MSKMVTKNHIELIRAINLLVEDAKKSENDVAIGILNPEEYYKYEDFIATASDAKERLTQAIELLESLKSHKCEYEDGYCIYCGRDAYA